ncbi:MAG: hypothetical protein MI861_28850 [Pirellulales bacterium]|nr:hypothetical protein [Pirellulales bacterium]
MTSENFTHRLASGAILLVILWFAMEVVTAPGNGMSDSAEPPAPAEAKETPQPSFPQYLMLVSSPLIQQDIQLDQGQRTAIVRLEREYMQSAHKYHIQLLEMLRLPDMTASERTSVSADMRRWQTDLSEDIDQQTLSLLRPEQNKRLTQLRLWAMGAEILLDPQLRLRLRISDQQLKQLQKAFLERDRACKEYLAEASKEQLRHDEIKAKINDIKGDAWSKMRALFTPTQKQVLREVLGREPAFKPSELQLRLSWKVR